MQLEEVRSTALLVALEKRVDSRSGAGFTAFIAHALDISCGVAWEREIGRGHFCKRGSLQARIIAGELQTKTQKKSTLCSTSESKSRG